MAAIKTTKINKEIVVIFFITKIYGVWRRNKMYVLSAYEIVAIFL